MQHTEMAVVVLTDGSTGLVSCLHSGYQQTPQEQAKFG